MNTFVLAQDFEYLQPRTIDEALQCLMDRRGDVKIMAGGTDLLVQMKTGKLSPSAVLHLSRISALRYLIEQEGLRLGALTTFRDILGSPLIRSRYTALYEAARSVSTAQIQSMGTIGGNLSNGSPAADSAPPLLVFQGKVRLIEGWQERVLPLEEFFVGPGVTALRPGELLVEVILGPVAEGTGSAFKKISRVSADLAKVSLAVAIVRKEGRCEDCRMALGAVAPVPMRARKSEGILMGERLDERLIERASTEVSREISPIDDLRSTAWYRREVVKAITREAIRLAWERAAP